MNPEARQLVRRFGRELRPTLAQGLGALVVALAMLVVVQSQQIFERLGIGTEAIEATRDQVLDRFRVILESNIAGNLALVAFWAGIGLVAYLLCWGAYNLLVEARNEVTIETAYTNRGRWSGPLQTLALKSAAAVLLVLYLTAFQYGLSLWLALAAPLLTSVTTGAVLMALAAVLGLAVQLYGLLFLVQLTMTPWYGAEAFTN